MRPATFQRIRLYCYITWAVIEPTGLIILIWLCLKIIRLLEGLQ